MNDYSLVTFNRRQKRFRRFSSLQFCSFLFKQTTAIFSQRRKAPTERTKIASVVSKRDFFSSTVFSATKRSLMKLRLDRAA